MIYKHSTDCSMEYFVLLIKATTIACEKFITVTFHNSAANNIVFDYSYYSCSLSLFVDVCVCVCGGRGGYSIPIICN